MPSRRSYLRACALAGLAGAAGCLSDGSDEPTATPRSTETGDGVPPSPTATPTMVDDTAEPPTRTGTDRVAWESSLSGVVETKPALVDGTLYLGDTNGNLTAVATEDGSRQWQYGTDRPVTETPTVADDLVLGVSGRGALGEHHEVHAVDAATGARRWTFAPEEWWLDVLGTAGDTAYVATHDDALAGSGQTLYAVSLSDGTPRWSVEVGDNHGGLVTGDTVYVPAPGVVDAVDTMGTPRWHREVGEYQFDTIAAVGDTVALVTGATPDDWTVRGLDAATGDERWAFDDWTAHTTRAAGDRLFVGGEKVARLDPATGEPVWTVDQRAALYDAPVVDGTLYVAGEAAAAIATDDGTVRWRTPLAAHLASPAGLTDGTLVVHRSESRDDRNRHVRGFDAASGDPLWTFAGQWALTEPVVDGGRAYVVEHRHVLALDA
jgi:outer membrane protein assembly factor BamB